MVSHDDKVRDFAVDTRNRSRVVDVYIATFHILTDTQDGKYLVPRISAESIFEMPELLQKRAFGLCHCGLTLPHLSNNVHWIIRVIIFCLD